MVVDSSASVGQPTSSQDHQLPTDEPIDNKDEPFTSAVADEPFTSAVADEPFTSAVADEPFTSAVADEPFTSAVAHEPFTSAVADEPFTFAVADEPSNFAMVDEPSTFAVADEPSTFAMANEPSTFAVANEPSTFAVADEPSAFAVANEPFTSAMADDIPDNDAVNGKNGLFDSFGIDTIASYDQDFEAFLAQDTVGPNNDANQETYGMESAPLNGHSMRHEGDSNDGHGSVLGFGDDAHSVLSNSPFGYDDGASAEALQHPMELRVGPRSAPNGYGPTWMDKDKSGDYDPSKEGKFIRSSAPKRKRSPSAGDRVRKIQRAYSSRSALVLRQSGASYCLCLPITSARGLELLSRYTDSDNWPEDHNIFTADLEVTNNGDSYAFRHRKSDEEEEYSAEDLVGHPEARGCKQCYQLNMHCSMRDIVGAYPCEACKEEGDRETCEPLVPPKHKRACENCQACKVPCSYVVQTSTGPCEACLIKGFKCIAGPAHDPTRTRIGDDGLPTCDPNLHDGVNSVIYDRTHKTCAPCRRTHGWCSLRNAGESPPCAKCKKNGTPCSFENVHTGAKDSKNSKSRKVLKRERAERVAADDAALDPLKLNREQLLEVERHRAASKKGVPKKRDSEQDIVDYRKVYGTVTTIKTALSHPITFNTLRNDAAAPCSWCAGNPFYPIMGHYPGLREVKVVAWDNGAGYEELHGGYSGDGGQQPSRMCGTCTLERVRVVFCKTHLWQPIQTILPALEGDDALDPSKQWAKAQGELEQQQAVDVDEQDRGQKPKLLMRALKSTMDGGKPKSSQLLKEQLHRWCAVCPSPAAHECCAGSASALTSSADQTVPGRTNVTNSAQSGGKRGCGLRLCKICYRLLTSQHFRGGDFPRFIREIGEKLPKKYYPRGLRADYTFLDGDTGLLMKQVLHGKGMMKTQPLQGGVSTGNRAGAVREQSYGKAS